MGEFKIDTTQFQPVEHQQSSSGILEYREIFRLIAQYAADGMRNDHT